MNKIYLIGNLTGDPELRTTPNGVSVCTLNIAVNRRFVSSNGERQTDFFRVTAWRQLGETCARFLSKGRKVAVIGEVTARAYTAKDGTARASLEVTADEVEFLSPRDQQAQDYQPNNQGYQSNQGYRPSYPQQDNQSNSQGTPLNYGASRQNSWQESHTAPHPDAFTGTAFEPSGNSSDGFTEISDADLPF
ncbi:MAG: single-stranded DNA-binding protein [Christensenellaceae bacterium]|nr:single-stranded DNA-binding protein [Christensenellaceae bacterium]